MTNAIQKLQSLLENVRAFKGIMNDKYQTEIVLLNKQLETAHDQARKLKRGLLMKLITDDSADAKKQAAVNAKSVEKQPTSMSLESIKRLVSEKKV